eukprot:2450973-Rhodomonas_salina.1
MEWHTSSWTDAVLHGAAPCVATSRGVRVQGSVPAGPPPPHNLHPGSARMRLIPPLPESVALRCICTEKGGERV